MPAGNIADISFAVQTAKGTPSAPGVATMGRSYLAGGGLMAVKETADLEETGGIRLRTGNFVTGVTATGSPEFFARPDMLGWLLWGAMGTKVTSGAGDPWTHTFTLTATQPYMTFWRMLGAALFERFGDCKIASLTIHSAAAEPVRITAEVMGLAPASQTTAQTTATVEVAAPFMHSDGKALLIFEGSPVSAIDTVDLTIAANVTTQQGDDVVPFQAAEGMYEITIATEQTLLDFAMYNRMIYGAAIPTLNAGPSPNVIELSGASIVNLKYSKRDTAGAPVAPERSLNITADRLAISEVTGIESNTSGEPLRMAVTYKVYQPAGGASGLTAILKNGKTAYAAS